MSESFRPHESSSIDEGLRIRLEGTIELLEDALPLLDSLTFLMGRDEPSHDDLETLQECINQLPRIAEAIDVANRHEQAIALTLAVGQRVNTAFAEANRRLVQLGQESAPSLRAAVQAVLAQMRRQGTLPQPGERRLMESAGVAWGWVLFLSGLVTATAFFNLETFAAVALGAFAGILSLLLIPSYPWVLLPGRLHIPARRGALAHDILPSAMEELSIEGDTVFAKSGNQALALRTSAPVKLLSLLCLLKSPSLAGLQSAARDSVVLDAVDEETKERGRALVTTEGVLFVPASSTHRLVTALVETLLPAEPTLDEVLLLLAHLPTERWSAVSAHLGLAADARWFPKGGTVVEKSDNASLGILIGAGASRVRIVSAATTQARALLEGLTS